MRPANEVHYSKKMTLDQVLTFSFSNIFKQVGAYGQWLLLSLIVVMINLVPVGAILLGIDFSSNIPFYLSPETAFENVNAGMIGLAAVTFIIAVLIDIFFAFFSATWFYRVGLDGYDGVKRSFGERLRLAFQELGPIAAVTLLIGIISFVILMPYLGINFLATFGESAELEALSLVVYLITLPFVYFLSVKFSCAYGLILEEHKGIMESMKLSWQMTKGRGWRIFGYLFLVGLLAGLLIMCLMIPAIILWVVTALAEFTPALLGISIVLSIITYMVMVCIQYGITSNLPIAVYKRLCIEHAEDAPALGDSETVAPKADDIQF